MIKQVNGLDPSGLNRAHEKQLEENLEDYEEVVEKYVLDSWFQYPPPPEHIHDIGFKEIDKIEDLSIDEIINIGLKFDDMLLKLYEESAEKVELQGARDVFNNLVEKQKVARRNFVRQTFRAEDL